MAPKSLQMPEMNVNDENMAAKTVETCACVIWHSGVYFFFNTSLLLTMIWQKHFFFLFCARAAKAPHVRVRVHPDSVGPDNPLLLQIFLTTKLVIQISIPLSRCADTGTLFRTRFWSLSLS